MKFERWARALAIFAGLIAGAPAFGAQDTLFPDTEIHEPALRFDWPDIQVGVGAYQEGPTGLTIIRFARGAAVVADSRGGAPGTVNTDALRLGYAVPRLDAIVFAGGSTYGEEAIAAVMTSLKDDGVRSGAWDNVALAAGAIIYDFGNQDTRLNEVYPDKRLARAALHALRPGAFPLGAQGAGRMAMQGDYFGCLAHSGQGAAFREVGGIKIAAFVVVNASGSVTDREGAVVNCNRASSAGNRLKIADLMQNVPQSREPKWDGPPADAPTQRNTTVSLIVTNKKLNYAGLQRLAIQVHTSMARAIQPFSTFDDGDTLFAASTDETDGSLAQIDLDTLAGETMWDAILASAPQPPAFVPPQNAPVAEDRLRALVGTYEFAPHEQLRVSVENGGLSVLALDRDVFEFRPRERVPLRPESDVTFLHDASAHTRLNFTVEPDGHVTGATLNPGPWAQRGRRLPD